MEPTTPQNNTTHIHMPHISREILYIIGAFLLGSLLTYLIYAQQSQKDTQKQTVTIIGTGTVDIPADQVSLYGRISVAANTEKFASDELQKTIDSLKKKILAMGVSEAELNISYPYISAPLDNIKPITSILPAIPDDRIYLEEYSPTTKSSKVLGISTPTNAYLNSYVGSSSIDILLGKDKFALSDKLIKLINDTPNAASEGKPYYQIKTTTPYINEAREKALIDAKEQVDKIASINKLHVKKVVSIRENTMKNQNEMQPSPLGASIFVDPVTKKGPLSVSYEVKYELTTSFLPF